MVEGQPGLCKTPVSIITRAKWTGGMAGAVEHLFYKFKPWYHQILKKSKHERSHN
jgi:hypothetical protein